MPSLFIQRPAMIIARSTILNAHCIPAPTMKRHSQVTNVMDRSQEDREDNIIHKETALVSKEKIVEDILDESLTCDDFISKYFNLVSSENDSFVLAPLQPIPSIELEFDSLETISGDSSVSTMELIEDETMDDVSSIDDIMMKDEARQ